MQLNQAALGVQQHEIWNSLYIQRMTPSAKMTKGCCTAASHRGELNVICAFPISFFYYI